MTVRGGGGPALVLAEPDERRFDPMPHTGRGAIVATVYGACALAPAIGAEPAFPNFAPNPNGGWVASGKGFGVDFVQPPRGAGPVTNDPAYPYLTNAEAARSGRRPTYRVADLTNPILKPWPSSRCARPMRR